MNTSPILKQPGGLWSRRPMRNAAHLGAIALIFHLLAADSASILAVPTNAPPSAVHPSSHGPKPGLAPLRLRLPLPAFIGTRQNIPLSEHVEPPSFKPRPLFWAPAGVENVALHKKVTSSVKVPISGNLDLVTDGDKESSDSTYVELRRRTQWVQIDLGAAFRLYAILIWHAHNADQVYHDVVVQVSDNEAFTESVRTLFNNDWDNSSGLGVGQDKEYWEDYQGRLIDAKGVMARYVRLYSNGSTFSKLNRYTEVEVYGLKAAGGEEN